MAPKKKKGKIVDWADDEHFSKDRSIFYIEHTTECPIFQVKADECLTFFQQRIPEREFQLVRNKNGKQVPRDGAFEVFISQNARTSEHELWSGMTRGPPRRDKFPQYEDLVSDVNRVLRKFYPDKAVGIDEDEMDM
ncbi:selenoprotein BthD [Drosophila novamexicana]|uniref:selenoprotein BthD n=1 Tax=Drosophila novamexicana TaxID=47314 RepID=UPI0011E5E26F|nr:selenoprotein BthD [Drosophila novamexicana]XP_030554469.1 selenoprotein BthD [Drosophila novamexicana]